MAEDAELLRCAIVVVIYFVGTLFEMLTNIGGLRNCAAPMDIWIVMEFIFIIGIPILFCFLREYQLQFFFWVLMFAVAIWNVSGFFMLLYAEHYTPACIPEGLKTDMEIVLCIFSLIGGIFLISVVWIGGSQVFNKIFHFGQTEARQVYMRLGHRDPGLDLPEMEGQDWEHFDLEGYLEQRGQSVDSYAFTENEISILEGLLSKRYEHSPSRDNTCPICLEEYKHGERVLMHPVCYHIFHPHCLKAWLRSHASCPLCRRGSRSSLMRQIKNSSSNETLELRI